MPDTNAEVNHVALRFAPGTQELVACGAEDGAAHARAVATRTWVTTSRFVSRFVYTTCYTISYGVVFSTTLLAQAIPTNNAAVRGLIDGAHAAVHQLDQLQQGAGLDSPVASSLPALAPA
jgi:hypothetical protein